MKGVPFKLISSDAELDQLIAHCKQTGYACIDFETNGLEFHDPEKYPTILGVSFQIGSAWIIPLGHKDSPWKGNWEKRLRRFSRMVLEDPAITKIAWNGKFEEKWLFRYGCKIIGRFFDGMLAKYLLDEERPNDLKSFVGNYIPKYFGYEDEIHSLVKKHGGWGNVPIEPLAKYCALDCTLEFEAYIWLEQKLIKNGFYSLYRNMYMPRSRGLAECEYEGALIDKPYLTNLIQEYEKKIADKQNQVMSLPIIKRFEKRAKKDFIKKIIAKIQDEIDDLDEDAKNYAKLKKNREDKIDRIIMGNTSAKETYTGLNLGSPPQLINLLYRSKRGFRFPILDYTLKDKKPTDNPSTAEETLLKLKKRDKHGFIDALLELRGLQKLYSTYIKGIYEILDDQNRVHPSFKLHGTVTGRLSCVEPNLQNVPRDTTSSDIKRMFIAPPGTILLEIDYSQAELRIVAEWANEKTMIEWFRIGRNVHVASACRANKVEDRYDEILKITKDEDHPDHVYWTKRKKRAKTINFGILYEQSPKMLKETLEKDGEVVSVAEAEQYMKDWFKDFPRIKKFMDSQHKLVKKQGFVTTMFGQKRRLPNIDSHNFSLMLQAQRQSTNAPVQGSAAQFGTFSSVIVRQERKRGNLRGIVQEVYNVHDSIGFYIYPEYIHELVPKLVEICANPSTMKYFGFEMKKVKMQVNAEASWNWGQLRGYHPEEDYTKLLNR